MDRYLMTHSLLSSWLYAMSDTPYADATNEKDPMEDFMQVLRREPTPTNEHMQKGIDFENEVTHIVNGGGNPDNGWYEAAKQVADEVRGGILQYTSKKLVHLPKRDVLLYGRLDALKSGVIYDIKYSGSYDVGKYRTSTQHPMYMTLVPEAREFVYLVSNGKHVWREPYRREETADVMTYVEQFFGWLDSQGLDEVYRNHWLAR